LYKVYSIFT